ncbi:thiamine pyrophosphate-dependent enzyme [Pseudomonas aeruginosa]|nr:thiamine pyrophosphate-dependent enzyme [Pseudomonas aeruginosa]
MSTSRAAGSAPPPATAPSAMACPPPSAPSLGEPGRPVVSLMGDGGLQFTLPELASAVEAKVGIVVLLWNNHGYGEIKRYMERREITPARGRYLHPGLPRHRPRLRLRRRTRAISNTCANCCAAPRRTVR